VIEFRRLDDAGADKAFRWIIGALLAAALLTIVGSLKGCSPVNWQPPFEKAEIKRGGAALTVWAARCERYHIHTDSQDTSGFDVPEGYRLVTQECCNGGECVEAPIYLRVKR